MARRRHSYGKVLPTHRWRGEPRWRRWLRIWRPWLLLAVLLGAWRAFDRYGPGEPPPRGTPQQIAASFVRCGSGRAANCVIDGDTFIMGKRHLRITGIDAPEIGAKARCPREAQLAEAAAAELLRLLNQGPVTLVPPEDGLRDDYGRELTTVSRQRPGGVRQDLAAELIASGKVRRYASGPRQGWC